MVAEELYSVLVAQIMMMIMAQALPVATSSLQCGVEEDEEEQKMGSHSQTICPHMYANFFGKQFE